MEAIVDRIEKDILILELSDKSTIKFPKKFLADAEEGDVITFSINKDETEKRKKEIKQRVDRLWKD